MDGPYEQTERERFWWAETSREELVRVMRRLERREALARAMRLEVARELDRRLMGRDGEHEEQA
jgi:predicted Fe-S protein YdhL (DUF1289 family)